MSSIIHVPCPSEAGERASLTPPTATCWQSVLSISAQLINYKRDTFNALTAVSSSTVSQLANHPKNKFKWQGKYHRVSVQIMFSHVLRLWGGHVVVTHLHNIHILKVYSLRYSAEKVCDFCLAIKLSY